MTFETIESKQVKDYMDKYGLTNKVFAKALGVSPYAINQWKQRGLTSKTKNFHKLQRVLKLDFYRDNVVDVPDELPCGNTWSVSRVNKWLESPWDFYCHYIKGLSKPSPWQDALDRGTTLHHILECIGNGVSLHSILQSIDLWANKEGLSDKGVADGIRVAEKYLNHYGSVESIGTVIETEKLIEWDLSEYLPRQHFQGYIDAVVVDADGGIWLVDYKTYSNKPRFENLRLELQCNVYMYVMKEILGYNVQGFVYDCINPKEKIVGRGYHFHQFKINYNEKIVNKVVEDFLSTIEIIINNPDYNIFKKSDYGTPYMDELVHGFEEENRIKIIGIEEDDS